MTSEYRIDLLAVKSAWLTRGVGLWTGCSTEEAGQQNIERCWREDAMYEAAKQLVDAAIKAHMEMFGISRETASYWIRSASDVVRSFNHMMRTTLFLALVGLSSILHASQQRTPQQVSKPSIEIAGMKLHLGMTKADVAERFVETPIQKVTEDAWTIGKSGSLRFKNGKLIFVDRSWINAGDSQIDAIFAVVSSLNREGYFTCKVLADTKDVPVTDAETGRKLEALSGSFQRVWIGCGAKTVLIVKAKVGNHLNEDVSEQLGELDVP